MIRMVILAAAAALLVGIQAQACESTLRGNAYDQPINVNNPDNELFTKAVLHFVNIERCRNRRAALELSPGLIYASKGHAEDMAARKYFSHYDKRRGMRSVTNRVKAAGVPMAIAGENIAKNFFYVISGRPISLRREGACGMFYANGSRVPRHTYRSLAQEIVAGLMRSEGHRNNILHRRFDRMGVGIGVDRSVNCGEFYISQTFAGRR